MKGCHRDTHLTVLFCEHFFHVASSSKLLIFFNDHVLFHRVEFTETCHPFCHEDCLQALMIINYAEADFHCASIPF